MTSQKAVSLDSAARIDDNSEDAEDTKAALYEYIFGRANTDSLDRDEAKVIRSARSEVGPIRQNCAAALVGRRLAELGDEIDAQYHDEMEEIVQLTGSPENAFPMFLDVVKNLFEWDEQGGARINIGRIAALLAYCYHLVRTYINQHMSSTSLVSFLAMVSGWLIQFLIKAKFYAWLRNQGGWGQLLAQTTTGWGTHVFLVIGITSLAIWAYSYFRGR